MPYINIKIAGKPISETQKKKLHEATTKLMNEVMRKKPEVTVVSIEESRAENWMIATNILSEDRRAVYVNVKVTQGTNSKEEKAEFLRKMNDNLDRNIGDLSDISYIVIDEIVPDAWGHGGVSMEERFQKK